LHLAIGFFEQPAESNFVNTLIKAVLGNWWKQLPTGSSSNKTNQGPAMGQHNKRVTIYTDGACLGNPGPGGWGAVLIQDQARWELSGGYKRTTNNRMELMAVIGALRSVTSTSVFVELYTDSKYLHDAVNKGWLDKWKRNGWRTADKKPVKNRDLWLELDGLLQSYQVQFHWVRGHSGHPENEHCDKLASEAALGSHLPDDAGYV
jgi:ribonuclease HI